MSNAPVIYLPGFLTEVEAETAFNLLWNTLPWERRPDAPRREFWMNSLGRPYTYGKGAGKRTYEPNPFNRTVEKIAEQLFKLGTRMHFEGCFLNGYEGPRDSLGWHSDDDPRIDHERPIVVVTLYSSVEEGMSSINRTIQFRPNPRNWVMGESSIETQFLEQGSVLIMQPGMQQTHEHRIPKAGFNPRKRISLTYRGLIAG